MIYVLSCVENHRDRLYCVLGCFSTEAQAQDAQEAHTKGRFSPSGSPHFHYRIDACDMDPSMDAVLYMEP